MRTTPILLILIFAAFAVVLVPEHYFSAFNHLTEGNLDLITYWSAFKLLLSGVNPYNDVAVHTIQSELGLDKSEMAKMMWAPPWLLIMLSPILTLSFSKATIVWILLNCVFALLTVEIVLRSLKLHAARPTIVVATTFIFYPVLETIQFGQTSLFITFFLTLALFCFINSKDYLAGALFTVTTIKPHLFIALGIVVLWSIIRDKRWKTLTGFFGTLLLYVTLSLILDPLLLKYWLENLYYGPSNGYSAATTMLKTATTVTQIREIVISVSGNDPVWLLKIMPILTSLLTFAYLYKNKIKLNFQITIPALLTFSLVFAPFSWGFDSAILLVVQASIVGQLYCQSHAPNSLIAIYFATQIFAFFIISEFCKVQQDLFWFPIFMLFSLLYFNFYSKRCLRSTDKVV